MIQDIGDFASGREFAAFLGLTPRQSSTRGKPRLGRITKIATGHGRSVAEQITIVSKGRIAPLQEQPQERPESAP